MDDSDDIFKDFEAKVKGRNESPEKSPEKKGKFFGFLKKEPTSKTPEKEHKTHREKTVKEHLSEKELLKRKYEEEKQALKKKYDKEVQVIHEKQIKEAIKKGNFNPKLAKIERIIYIVIIVVLLGYLIIDLSFLHGERNDEAEAKDDITASFVKEENKTTETKEPDKKEVKEPVKEDKKKVKEEKDLSGSITLTMDKIHFEKKEEDLGYITQIDFTIDNGKDKVLNPLVDVYIYDESTEVWELKSRGQYPSQIGIEAGDSSIKAGDSRKGIITVSPKTFRNLNLKKSIRLALNDTKGGFITAVNDAITIS